MIHQINDLAGQLKALKESGNRIVLCHGTFDGLHIGHVKYFQAAREFGDILVVTLTPDRFVNKGLGRPIFNEQLRAEAIDAVRYVDFVAITEEVTGIGTIRLLKPNYYVKGQDYKNLDDDPTGNIRKEKEAVESIGGQLKFTNELMFHATSLLARQKLSKDTLAFLDKFKRKYTVDDVVAYLDKLSNLKVLVVSEYIEDTYQYGTTLGKAGKFPIVAFRNDRLETYKGGSLAIVRHLGDFVDTVDVSTNRGAPIVKKRYVQGNQKLFETYTYPSMLFMNNQLYCKPGEYNLVLVADFGHGLLTKERRELIEDEAKFLAVAVQFNAGNMGMSTINKYTRWNYACIDHIEVRIATNNQFDDMEDVIKDNFTGMHTMAVTMSKDGCIMYKNNNIQRIPPFATEVIDTVGAGDAFLAITAPLAYINAPADIIGFIGNCVGAIACGWPGNKDHITKDKLIKFIKQLME